MSITKRKGLLATIGAILLVCLIALGAWMIHEHRLNAYRDGVLSELEARRGEYDEQSIVLYNTSKGQATELSERFSAALRITENGRFATLTLPMGTTIEDVFSDKANREVWDKLAPDYSVRITEYDGKFDFDDDDESKRHPQRPNYGVADNEFNSQTYLDYLNLQNVWNTTTGSGITVAVIDTGIDTDHPEFWGKISEYSYNASEDKIVKDYLTNDGPYDWSLIEDEQGHGTSVTGVLAASMDGDGIVGVAPNVTLLVIKAECDANGTFKRTSDLVFGL